MVRRALTAGVGSIVMTVAAWAHSPYAAWGGAGLTLVALIALTFRSGPARRAHFPLLVWRQAWTCQITLGFVALFLWAGLAMGMTYYLTDLSWYHAYQYALGFLIVAGAAFLVVRWLGGLPVEKFARWQAPLMTLVALQLAGAAIGVEHLVSSGKILAMRADWMANVIFATAGAGALIAAIMSAVTMVRE